MQKEDRFPAEVEQILRNCGWYPGRRVNHEVIEAWREYRLKRDTLDMPPAARAVLEEFGGLVIRSSDRGVDFARLTLSFNAEGDSGQFLQGYVAAAGVGELYPLGSYGDGFGNILIARNGAIYVDFRLDSPAGKNIDEALVRLLLGVKW